MRQYCNAYSNGIYLFDYYYYFDKSEGIRYILLRYIIQKSELAANIYHIEN